MQSTPTRETLYELSGWWREEDGTLSPDSALVVSKQSDGTFHDPENGARLIAKEYTVINGMNVVLISSELGAWEFVTTPGDCKLIGWFEVSRGGR